MKVDLVFLLATLGTYAGIGLVLAGLAHAIRGLLGRGAIGPAVAQLGAGLATWLVCRLVLPEVRADFSVPIFWPIAPFAAWVAFVTCIAAVWKLAQGLIEGSAAKQARTIGALAAVAVLFGWWHQRSGDSIELVKGAIPMSFATAAILLALAVVTIAAMVVSERAARTRRIARQTALHLTLMLGSAMFGLPFLWLLITSFKEDIDMSSANGLVWIPKVQQMSAFRDPADPMVTGTFEGRTVEGHVLSTDAQGVSTVEILRPLAMSSKIFTAPRSSLTEIDKEAPMVTIQVEGQTVTGRVVAETEAGHKIVEVLESGALKGRRLEVAPAEVTPIRKTGLRWSNYRDALDFLPPETYYGAVYLKNTLLLVILNIIGTVLSSSLVAYGFARMRFPWRDQIFLILLSTMMLPAAVTMLPSFLIFRSLGWIDTLYPLWVPAFFAGAFNVFLLRQFFLTLPNELEDAAKMDGCSHLRTYWNIMLPQVKPALAVIAVWTFIGTWNNFMGPLIYVNTPENMPIAYAIQLFQADRGTETGLLMAFATMAMLPVLALFVFAQRFFIEGVSLSGLGGR